MSSPVPSVPDLRCRRNPNGKIVALTRENLSQQQLEEGGWTLVSAGDAEVKVFMRGVASQVNALSQTDTSIARVLEDLIDLMITRGLIHFTELPQEAQAKLLRRRETRANLSDRLDLLSTDDDNEQL